MRRRFLIIVLLAVFCGGCTKAVAVKVGEIPKVSEMVVAPARSVQSGRTDVVAISTATLERTDGRLLQVKGEAKVRISTTDGQRVLFKAPVKARIENDNLFVAGSNRAETKFPLSQVQLSEVIVPDQVKSVVVGAGLGAGAVLIPALLLLLLL